MIARRAEGRPVAQIAEELGVSARTVYKWLQRWKEGGRAALANRASAPDRPGNSHADDWRGIAEHLRREYRMTGAEIADRLRIAPVPEGAQMVEDPPYPHAALHQRPKMPAHPVVDFLGRRTGLTIAQ